jgi:hypothetical protein
MFWRKIEGSELHYDTRVSFLGSGLLGDFRNEEELAKAV